MRANPARIALMVLTATSLALPVSAYVYPLSSTDIRDAYMTAQRNDELTADFFASYSHSLPMPEKGPHVAVITLATPFYQVVESTGKANYHSTEAEKDYLGKPFDFILRVQVDYTATYPERSQTGPLLNVEPLPDFQHDFKVTLAQDKNADIPSKSEQLSLIFFDGSPDLYGVTGGIMEFHYDPSKIDSDTATVTVDTPDGQHVETTFNLMKLR